jgi:hypothetical protein
MKVVPVRVPIGDIESLKGWARLRSRDFSKEVRLAIQLHLRELMLAHLSHEAGREDVRRQGFDPDEEVRWLTDSLELLRAKAYRRPERRFRPSPRTEAATR